MKESDVERLLKTVSPRKVSKGFKANLLRAIGELLPPLTWFAYAYPVLMLAALYTTWFVAWAVLGHSPRPSLDDPKSISAVVDIPHVLTWFLLLAMPGAMVLGACLTPLHLRASTHTKGALVARTGLALLILTGLWVATIAVLLLDPWNVSMWFMD